MPGRIISSMGVISQFDAHYPSTPFIEFEPINYGYLPTRLLLLRSWCKVPTACLKEPDTVPRPPADENY